MNIGNVHLTAKFTAWWGTMWRCVCEDYAKVNTGKIPNVAVKCQMFKSALCGFQVQSFRLRNHSHFRSTPENVQCVQIDLSQNMSIHDDIARLQYHHHQQNNVKSNGQGVIIYWVFFLIYDFSVDLVLRSFVNQDILPQRQACTLMYIILKHATFTSSTHTQLQSISKRSFLNFFFIALSVINPFYVQIFWQSET